jgi:uncharacterized protein DUF5666
MSRWALLVLLAFGLDAGLAAAQLPAAVEGYVTAVASPAEFKVDGTTVRCVVSTRLNSVSDEGSSSGRCPVLWIGQRVVVRGQKDKSGAVMAAAVGPEAPAEREVRGSAVIDRIVEPADASGIMVSADGYTILIPSSVHPMFKEPLTTPTPISTNLWLNYSGTQRTDGIVVAKAVVLSANILKRRERKANEKREFDPAAVSEKDRQSGFSKGFKGVDPKRFPAVHDEAMQQRVDGIARKLIPTFQRDLPANDASKINFRFQIVDAPKYHDALTLPNGIILVPRHIVAQLTDDSQLATVIADNIACALEKQDLRLIPARRGETAGSAALLAAGAVVPGLGFASLLETTSTEAAVRRLSEEQSGRVSLVLLRQAGFNIDEAPRTWWLLSSKNKPLDRVAMPFRAKYLYGILGTTWNVPQPAAAPIAPAAE